MPRKVLFAFAIMVAVMTIDISASTPSAVMNRMSLPPPYSGMLNLKPSSDCAALGYPGTIPHILPEFESGPGRCCIGIYKKGGFIQMCLENGGKDEWLPCPPGTCNQHNVSSKDQTSMDDVSSEHVCLTSSECGNQKVKKETVEPEVNCDKVSALPGDSTAVINCTVKAPDVTCGKVVWQSGLTDQEFTHKGSKTPRVNISCESIGQSRIWTQLEVRDLEEKDFDNKFYVKVKGGPGGDYQKGQRIKRRSMTNTLTATSTLVLVALCTAFCLITIIVQ